MEWVIFTLAFLVGCSQMGTSSGVLIIQDGRGRYHRYLLSESYYEGQVIIEGYCYKHRIYETVVIGNSYGRIEKLDNER